MATFSSMVKTELCEVKFSESDARAELAAMMLFGENLEDGQVVLKTDKAETAARIQSLLKKALKEELSIDILKGRKAYSISISDDIAEKAGVYFSDDGEIALDEDVCAEDSSRRAFLRGAFVISGTISDPKKGYDCELLTYNENMAYFATELLEEFGIKANIVKRNNFYVTYLKDTSSISDFLNIVGAHKLMMDFMVTQIEKDFNNRANRTSICKAANLDKTIAASAQQCKAILNLQKLPVWQTLDEDTKTLAMLRLDNVDMPLSELGRKMSPQMSKSSVNRRMKKLIDLAEDL